MNSTELFLSDGRPAGVWFCGKCRDVAGTKERAEECCKPNLCACGKECRPYYADCDECSDAAQKIKDHQRFEKAETVDPETYDGPVAHPESDRYWENLDDFLSMTDTDERPEYLWCCTVSPVCTLDTDRIIEDATQEAYDGFDSDDLNGIKDLDEAIARFNEANSEVTKWEADWSRKILTKDCKADAELAAD